MQLGEVTLRPYQERAVQDVRSEIARLKAEGKPPRVLVVCPCGGGKTLLSSAIIRGALDKGKTSLFMASGRILIEQKARTLGRCGIPHAILMRGEEFWQSHVCVASKDTYHARVVASDKMQRFSRDVWIIDEAHLALSDVWMDIFMHDPEAVFIGFTATPLTKEGRGMGGFWQGMVKASTYSELIGLGYLVEARVFAPWSVDTRGLHSGDDGDWSWRKVSDRMNNRQLVGSVVENYQQHGEGRPFACFASSVEHSIGLMHEFNNAGLPCVHIDAETEPDIRRQAFADVESGKLRGITNYGVLRVGFDMPVLGCCILACATNSLRTCLQICGRGLRSHPSKKDCIFIDHGSNIERHLWPTIDREWSLDPDKDLSFRHQVPAGERPPQQPITCRKCGAMRESGAACPHCGSRFQRKGILVKNADGELVEIKKREVRERKESGDVQKRWRGVIGMCANTGRTFQQAKIIFHRRHGMWPPATVEPNVPESQQRMKVGELFPNLVRRKIVKG